MNDFKDKLTINWHSKVWWISVVSIMIVLIQQILKMFGLEMPAGMDSQILNIVNSLLVLGGLMGVIYDTSGDGGKNENENN